MGARWLEQSIFSGSIKFEHTQMMINLSWGRLLCTIIAQRRCQSALYNCGQCIGCCFGKRSWYKKDPRPFPPPPPIVYESFTTTKGCNRKPTVQRISPLESVGCRFYRFLTRVMGGVSKGENKFSQCPGYIACPQLKNCSNKCLGTRAFELV